jgi:DNA-binding NtrC family response regulator
VRNRSIADSFYTKKLLRHGAHAAVSGRIARGRGLALLIRMISLDTMLDLLDHGSDGEPRTVALDASDAQAAAQLVRLVAAESERRGYVPVAAERVPELMRTLPDDMRQRSFVVLQTCNAGAAPDTSALMTVAALNPRPHVLVTITIARRRFATVRAVREARTAYATDTASRAATWSPDVQKYVARAHDAFALARSGRHEPAVRVLREAVAALARRREPAAAACAGLLLGRVFLERGHADDAATTFAEVVTQLDPVNAADAAVARVWVAIARTDACRLTEAEGLLRATRLAGALSDEDSRKWADGALARCLTCQDRNGEAVQLLGSHGHFTAEADPSMVVPVFCTYARVLLALGKVFEAGQRARAGLERAESAADPVLRVIAGIAHLRVLAAAGDLDLAAERKAALLAESRNHHQPLHALRVRLIWADMLRKAGRQAEAWRELQGCARLAKAAPELLKRRVQQLVDAGPLPRIATAAQAGHGAFAIGLLRLVQEDDDDREAIQKLLDRICEHLRAGRVELQSAAAGPLATIVSAGTGLAARLGVRALETGIVVGPEHRDGVCQAAVPVRAGHRVLGVVTCRWPLGRDPMTDAAELLELGATIIAPRMDLLLAARSEAAKATTAVPELIGESDAIEDVRQAISRAAAAPFGVLIEGESGCGKELVARAIHFLSARRERRFCDINCAALPEELVESELFGHAKGAFTGALVERRGLFEEASGGTLFLDELPDLSLRSQAKLLRVVQQSEIRRVGETFGRRIDVRIVTAANRSMGDEVAAGRFRQDLLYRLDVLRISIPPLRARPADIPVLAQHFWQTASERAGTRAALSHAVLAELARYHWPGNVRELQNVMAALAVAAPARGVVRPSLLPPAITGSIAVTSGRLDEARRQFERRFIEVALARAGGSRTKAAAQLGVTRQGLLKVMARIGLLRPDSSVKERGTRGV